MLITRILTFCTSVEYTKKKDKKATISFTRDETVPRDDVYKSHTVHVPTGEPVNSVSRPAAKRKAGVVRPITKGKLLRPGGPGGSNVRVVCFSRCCGANSILGSQASSQTQAQGAAVTWRPDIQPCGSCLEANSNGSCNVKHGEAWRTFGATAATTATTRRCRRA